MPEINYVIANFSSTIRKIWKQKSDGSYMLTKKKKKLSRAFRIVNKFSAK